jgi:rod shape determining protein RodA
MSQRYGKQFIWILATLVIAIFILLIDNRFYFFFSWFVYAGMTLLLLMVLVIGTKTNGARSWFDIGTLSIQPSEFAKFGTALAVAAYLHSSRQELKKIRVIVPVVAIFLLPAVLIALQPDMGSTVVYFAFFVVLFREGMSPYIFVSGLLMIVLFFLTLLFNNVYLILSLILTGFVMAWFATRRWKYCMGGLMIFAVVLTAFYLVNHYVLEKFSDVVVILAALIVSGAIFAYFLYNKKLTAIMVIYLFLVGSIIFVNSVDYGYNHLLQPHQKERVGIMLGFKSDPKGTGYNVNQSLISIGSGGFSGKGYLQGTQTKFKFVPAQSTDFIFCTVGEEWGFIGTTVVIVLYLALLLRLIYMAERQRSVFSRVYGYGVASILFIHIFINIGMAIGIVPVIGIPLPFFSYGGSSLWGFTILLFIFLRLDASRSEYLM